MFPRRPYLIRWEGRKLTQRQADWPDLELPKNGDVPRSPFLKKNGSLMPSAGTISTWKSLNLESPLRTPSSEGHASFDDRCGADESRTVCCIIFNNGDRCEYPEVARACPQLSRMIAATNWTAARKFRASLS